MRDGICDAEVIKSKLNLENYVLYMIMLPYAISLSIIIIYR